MVLVEEESVLTPAENQRKTMGRLTPGHEISRTMIITTDQPTRFFTVSTRKISNIVFDSVYRN